MPNDQGWPPYEPPRPQSIDEITVGQAQEATNILLDCNGLDFIRFIDNRIAHNLNAYIQQWRYEQRSKRGDA